MKIVQSRRRFMTSLSLAGAVGLVGLPGSVAAEDPAATGGEPPPETATIRLPAIPAACAAPLYLAKELLHEEGFAEVHYVPTTRISAGMLADGELDFSMEAGVDYLPLMDAGRPLTVLAGVHVGCMELRANDSIQSIADLRGKRVGINILGNSGHLLVSTMAAYVGLDPAEIDWVADPKVSQVELFAAGKIDAFIGFPPDPKGPCVSGIGHVVVNIAADAPWSNYFCCMVTANADFVRNNPVATKRAMRAILKMTDFCHQQPERAAQRMVDHGFSYECALMVLSDARYGVWREYDPEDTARFFALRLHEVGMIKTPPNEIISRFTDWRILRRAQARAEDLRQGDWGPNREEASVHIIQNRRRFLTGLSLAGRRRPRRCTEIASRGAAAGNNHRPSAAVDRQCLLLGRRVSRRGDVARRRFHRCPLCAR